MAHFNEISYIQVLVPSFVWCEFKGGWKEEGLPKMISDSS